MMSKDRFTDSDDLEVEPGTDVDIEDGGVDDEPTDFFESDDVEPLALAHDDDDDDNDPDDELLPETDPEVIATLGFDPLDELDLLEEGEVLQLAGYDPSQPRDEGGKWTDGGGGGAPSTDEEGLGVPPKNAPEQCKDLFRARWRAYQNLRKAKTAEDKVKNQAAFDKATADLEQAKKEHPDWFVKSEEDKARWRKAKEDKPGRIKSGRGDTPDYMRMGAIELEEAFKKRFSAKQFDASGPAALVVEGDPTGGSRHVQTAKYIAVEAERVDAEFPGVDLRINSPFSTVIEPVSRVDGQYLGTYSALGSRIRIAGKGGDISAKEEPFTIGAFHATHGDSSTWRHELGHHIQSTVVQDKALDGRWSDMYVKHSSTWWEKKVSRYSATNHREGFAEAFAVYTSPLYDHAHPALPREIHNFMKQVTGHIEEGEVLQLAGYDPSQPRDDSGRWDETGAGGGRVLALPVPPKNAPEACKDLFRARWKAYSNLRKAKTPEEKAERQKVFDKATADLDQAKKDHPDWFAKSEEDKNRWRKTKEPKEPKEPPRVEEGAQSDFHALHSGQALSEEYGRRFKTTGGDSSKLFMDEGDSDSFITARHVAANMERMNSECPGLGLSWRGPVSVSITKGETVHIPKTWWASESSDAWGTYAAAMGGTIRMGARADFTEQELPITVGRFHAANGDASVFRHELGHHVEFGLPKEVNEEWRVMYHTRDAPQGGESPARTAWWTKKVSSYAATNYQEGFAEAFAAYTSPLYNHEKPQLPKEVHDFMKKITGHK